MLEFHFYFNLVIEWGGGGRGWPIRVQGEKAAFYHRLSNFDNGCLGVCCVSGSKAALNACV